MCLKYFVNLVYGTIKEGKEAVKRVQEGRI